jgi:hypothetical protein
MSNLFQFKYDAMKENDPTQENGGESSSDTSVESYSGIGNIRNISFELLNGDMVFLNYAYLVSGKYVMKDGSIELGFTTHTVTLKGYRLKPLYSELMMQIPQSLICVDPRYNKVQGDENPIINQIEVIDI